MRDSKDNPSTIEKQADELVRYWLELGHRMINRKLSASLYPELAGKLSRGQLHALIILAESGEPRISELASMLSLDESTVTRLVDKLEAVGAAERRRSTTDRRSTTVAITTPGREIVAQAHDHQRTFMSEVLSALDPAERAEFVRLTAKAAEALGLRTAEVVAR
ncbi:MAG: MarR family transcriptional regulator [Gaiellaceae bacterium]|jgi:DNA-binding MarR family transcriptional regulator